MTHTMAQDISGPVFKMQRFSIHDGPGIRTTLFFQGCPLSCIWCHNPESQAMQYAKDQRDNQDICNGLMDAIQKDLIFFDESGGGVTFSGGEPLCRAELVLMLARSCRDLDIHTCLDTSGYAPFDTLEKVSRMVDLILYDVKLADADAHRKYTGQPVGAVFENLAQLSDQGAALLLRFPLIPGITDSNENIHKIIERVKTGTTYRDIHILPFHKAADGKYARLKMKNRMKSIPALSDKKIKSAAMVFESHGFNVTLGG